MKRILTLFLSVVPLLSLAEEGKAPLGQAFVYKKADERELKLHVLYPPGWELGGKHPAIVLFHGGGWTKGGPWLLNDQAAYLASRGMVCAQVEYRLLSPDDNAPPTICALDAKSAIRWVRAHASELGIDPDRIAAGGSSAGGHLAAMLGTGIAPDESGDNLATSAAPQALVLFNPVIDNGPGGYGHKRVGDRYREFSPFHNVSASVPPTIILTGTKDALVKNEMIRDFARQMTAAGAKCEVHFYEDGEHGFYTRRKADGKFFRETLAAIDQFFVALGWLQKPANTSAINQP